MKERFNVKWDRFFRIIKERPLDRDTKLRILNLISVIDDPKEEEEVLKLVFAWENEEAQTERELIEKLDAILKNEQEQTAQAQQLLKKELHVMSDDMHKEQRIKELQEHIKHL